MMRRRSDNDCFVCDMIGWAIFALLLGFAFFPTETGEKFAEIKAAFDERVEELRREK